MIMVEWPLYETSIHTGIGLVLRLVAGICISCGEFAWVCTSGLWRNPCCIQRASQSYHDPAFRRASICGIAQILYVWTPHSLNVWHFSTLFSTSFSLIHFFGSDDDYWLLGQVHVHMRRVPMSELPQGADGISKWCHDVFEIKVRIKILGTHKVLVKRLCWHRMAY